MTHKTAAILGRVRHLEGLGWDARYLGYLECFNSGQYYESHDVLEDLWLGCKRGSKGSFYKALIQLAGAFVHLQKDRLGPAAALFRLADGYLSAYPDEFEGLSIAEVRRVIALWLQGLDGGNPLGRLPPPRLEILAGHGPAVEGSSATPV